MSTTGTNDDAKWYTIRFDEMSGVVTNGRRFRGPWTLAEICEEAERLAVCIAENYDGMFSRECVEARWEGPGSDAENMHTDVYNCYLVYDRNAVRRVRENTWGRRVAYPDWLVCIRIYDNERGCYVDIEEGNPIRRFEAPIIADLD